MLFRNGLNRVLASSWKVGVLPEPVLEVEHLEAAARRAERIARPVHDTHWREPLEQLLTSLRNEADLNALGRTMAWGQIVKILRERLRAQELWRRHPEIVERPIVSPIVVLGHMRSGTTRLHRLLACDERLGHSRFWEVMSPVPKPRRDWRRLEAKAGLKLLGALNPALKAVHPTQVDAAEEEFGLFNFSLYGAQIEAQWRVPGFARYSRGRDRRQIYSEFRMLLQTLAWSRADAGKRPWVLKAPQFMEDLEVFLGEFPDARLICLKRNPAQVVGSSASLVWNQMRVQSDGADKGWIGAEWLAKTALRERVSHIVRAARPDVPQIEVEYDDMNRDWLGQMRRIYAFLDLELTPALEQRMRAYLAAAEKSGFRGHAYSLPEFGLSPTTVQKTIGAAARAPI